MEGELVEIDCDDNFVSFIDDESTVTSSRGSSPDLCDEPLFRVLKSYEVAAQMNAEIKSLGDTLQLPPKLTRILFDRYKYNKELLMEKYFTTYENDEEAFFRDARIIYPLCYDEYTTVRHTGTCPICFDTDLEVTGLQCGHKFCNSCWKTYLTSRINSGGTTIPCAHTNCDIIVEDVILMRLVGDPHIISKYNRLICDHYVDMKKNLHWCPSPKCNFVIESDDCQYVTCDCNHKFCCGCYDDWHFPISCEHLKKWKVDDSPTINYLAANTKECPKCKCNIEKNGGCTQMTCQNCWHNFCWKCLEAWESHTMGNADYITCKTAEATRQIQESRTATERMKYCWARYAYNTNSLKKERERYKDLEWESANRQTIYAMAHFEVLYECRRFLMYSYAYLYFLEENSRVNLLEFNMDCLEATTDKLSENLEKYFCLSDFKDDVQAKAALRNKIYDNAVHCDALRRKWLSEIQTEECNESWSYRE